MNWNKGIHSIKSKQSNDDIDIKLYPNPTTSYIHVISDASTNENQIYQIYDFNGKKVMSGTMSTNDEIIDLSILQNGNYTLNVIMEEKSIVKRFVKID